MIPVIIEVAISLIVIYFLLSTVISFINEIIAMILNSRGKLLNRALKHLFKGDALIDKIYKSDYIVKLPIKIFRFSLFDNNKPEYIADKNFADALLKEINISADSTAQNITDFKEQINAIPNKFLKEKILDITDELIAESKLNIVNLKIKIQDWFNSYMDTVTVVYKNQTKIIVFIISLIVCFAMNIDSLVLMEYFYENKDKREVMIKFAENANEDKYYIDTTLSGQARLDALNEQKKRALADLHSFDLPISWRKGEESSCLDYECKVLGNAPVNCVALAILKKFLGIFITVISLTLGAPFWYQLMIKLLDLRKNINNKDDTQKAGS